MRGQATERAKMSIFVFSEQALGVVLDQRNGAIAGKIENCIQLAANASIMYCHDGSGALRDVSFDLCLIDVQRVGPDINKNRFCSTQNKRVGC